MAGPDPDSFQRALAKFKVFLTRTSPELIDQFSMTGPQDVKRVCKEIQDRQGQDGSLRRMRRMEGFIEAMDQLGKSIEVFVNANEFVCFVWGPVKFLLGVAKQYLDSFDKLLDVYAKVGEAMPGLMMYQSTFEKHRPLATVLEDYYSDILRFHEAALRVFMRPKWKTAFRSVWKTFDTQFKPIMDSLNRRRELLESEKGSAALHEISKSREEIAAFNEELKRQGDLERLEKHKWRFAHMKEKLEAPDYQLDQEMATEDRNGSNSGTWVLQNQTFRKWIDRSTREQKILYVNGIPGAGKTTLASFIVANILEDLCADDSDYDTLVVYFYFKHNQSDKRTHNGLLRAMMEQIMTRDPALSDHLFEELAPINGVNLRSTKKLESLVITSFEHFRTCLIVIDGLDEAAPGEAGKTLKWLLPVAERPVQDNGTSIRLLLCGQRDGILDHELSDQPVIALETVSDHELDIGNYCAQVGANIRSKFSISSEMESSIVSQVALQANGMFLYARVVLENLLSQTRLSRLRQEMQPGVFPDGIERAYERVAVRIFQDSPPAQRQDAAKILGWLICAERLPYWREIQAVFCIDPDTGQVDYEGERLRLSCKQLCGSLVDIHQAENGQDGPDDIVKIVHGTARDYMIRKQWINLSLEHAKAATFCFRYLTSMPFLLGDSDNQIIRYAKQGYYALQDYSVQYCLDHFLKSIEPNVSSIDEMMMLNAKRAGGDFLRSYTVSERLQVTDNQFSHEETTRFIKDLPKEPRNRSECFDITNRTAKIRGLIEQVRCGAATTEEVDIINNLYGFGDIFKCPKPWCNQFTTGFATRKDRTTHVNRHERPFYCPEEACFASRFGFEDEEKLKHHANKYHRLESTAGRFPKRTIQRQVARAYEEDLGVAAAQGDVASVLKILDSEADQESLPLDVALEWAAKTGHSLICKLLLDRGAKLFHEHIDAISGSVEIRAPALTAAFSGRTLGLIGLFLRQTNSGTAQVLRDLPHWMFIACRHHNADVLEWLLMSPLSQHIDNDNLDARIQKSVAAACFLTNAAPLQCLLEHGCSGVVTPDFFFCAESRGRRDLADLLRPFMDKTHPPRSLERAESLIIYLGAKPSQLTEEQMETLQSLDPAEQQSETSRLLKEWSLIS